MEIADRLKSIAVKIEKRFGKVVAAGLLVTAIAAGCCGCSGPLDETQVTEAGQRLIDAFGCDATVVDEELVHEPTSAAELARHSDLVLSGVVESVRTDPAVVQPRILVKVRRTAQDGSADRVTLQLYPANDVSIRDAAQAFVKGAALVAYTTSSKPVTWCGTKIDDPGSIPIPVSPFGLVIATGDPKERSELVWPLLHFTSWSQPAEALPGGNQYPLSG